MGKSSFRKWKHRLFHQNNGQPIKCCFCPTMLTVETGTAEHIIPRSKGGKHTDDNLTLSCNVCNNDRGDMDFEEYRRLRAACPFRPIGRLVLAHKRNQTRSKPRPVWNLNIDHRLDHPSDRPLD